MLNIFFSTSFPLITLYLPFTITVGTLSNTPAFPAGHAAQAYILASHFGKIYAVFPN